LLFLWIARKRNPIYTVILYKPLAGYFLP